MHRKPLSVVIAKIVATFFGLGYIPFAPGTFGALGGLLISYALTLYCTAELSKVPLSLSKFPLSVAEVVLVVAAYLSGVWACRTLADEWGQDPSKVVIDEALGFWVSIIALPHTPFYLIGGFLLFRLFDITKPFGIRRIDNWHTPHAVMLDDVAAGVAANVVLQLVHYTGYGV
jgi:phosphatidylglycerophosphatase A